MDSSVGSVLAHRIPISLNLFKVFCPSKLNATEAQMVCYRHHSLSTRYCKRTISLIPSRNANLHLLKERQQGGTVFESHFSSNWKVFVLRI